MKVGFIELAQNTMKLERQVEEAIRNRWLDADTALEFEKKIPIYRRQKGGLQALLAEVNKEINHRMKVYGGG